MIQEAYLGDYRHTRDPKVWKKQDGKYAMVIGSKVAYEKTTVEKHFSMKVKMEFILNIKTAIKNQLLEICGNVQMSLKSMINSL